MRALLVSEFGKRPELTDTTTPDPGPNDVLIRVEATGLNFADLLMIEGRYQATPELPFALGLEVSGYVEAVGTQVAGFAKGDPICAQVAGGGLAEFAVAPASACWRVPDGMPMTTAAGFQITYGTSYLALLDRARLRPGETLVVLGAAGGVGLTAVEIGAALGARVIAVARGAEKAAIAKAAGASIVLDSDDTDDLKAALKHHGGVDVVYDAVGGDLGAAAFGALLQGGRFIVIGFASGDVPALKLNHAMVKNIDIIGVYWGAYAKLAPQKMTDALQELAAWHVAGKITPRVDVVPSLDGALDALDRLRQRDATGKLVVQVQSAP